MYVRACVLSYFSHFWLCATLWTAACQTPLSMGFSRQEYWSGLPPENLLNPGIELVSLNVYMHWQAGSLPLAPPVWCRFTEASIPDRDWTPRTRDLTPRSLQQLTTPLPLWVPTSESVLLPPGSPAWPPACCVPWSIHSILPRAGNPLPFAH